jgi:hypothetical protein
MTNHFKYRIRGSLRAGPLRRLCEEAYGGCVHVVECQTTDLSRYTDETILPNQCLVVAIATPSAEEALHLADRVGVELCPDEFLLELLSE